MADICPHCGASIPGTRDAFCPQCRGQLSENQCGPLKIDESAAGVGYERGRRAAEYFTIPGRILVLTTFVLGVGGPWLMFMWLHDSLTPGEYPLWFFGLPIWTALACAFVLTAAVLKRFGISVFRQPDDRNNVRGETVGGADDEEARTQDLA
jgi:hypothetical protein